MTKPPDPAGGHLGTREALDYLEARMDAAARSRAERHLGSPCKACHELVREFGWLVERLRLDLEPAVPDRVRARALAVFQPPPAVRESVGAAARLARLLFDSWTQPLPAGSHRSVGEMRRLRFALGGSVLELESEIESSETRMLRGRLRAPDPSLHRIVVAVGSERLSARPDPDGSFAFDRVPLGRTRVMVTAGHQSYRIPPIE